MGTRPLLVGCLSGWPVPPTPMSLLQGRALGVPAQSSLCGHVPEALVPGTGTAQPTSDPGTPGPRGKDGDRQEGSQTPGLTSQQRVSVPADLSSRGREGGGVKCLHLSSHIGQERICGAPGVPWPLAASALSQWWRLSIKGPTSCWRSQDGHSSGRGGGEVGA